MFSLTGDVIDIEAARAAGWLRAHGVESGDRVAVAAANRPEYVALTLGALRTGVVPVLVNVHLGTEERDRITKDCDPALVVTDAA